MRRWSVGVVMALVALAGCAPLPPAPPAIQGFGTAGAPFSSPALVAFRWVLTDLDGGPLTCRIDAQGDGTWELTIDPCPTSGSRNLPMLDGTHTAVLEVSDGAHAPVTATTAYSVAPGPTEPYDIELAPASTLDPAVREAYDRAVARWQSVIVRGVPSVQVDLVSDQCGPTRPFSGVVDDLVIDVVVAPIPGGGYAGAAAPCVEGPDLLPRFAFVQLESTLIDNLVADDLLDDLIAHEVGHALGFDGRAFEPFIEGGFASPDPRFNGPRAVAAWSELGQPGLPALEWPGSHWSEHDFVRELMTPGIGAKPNPLSIMTVAVMADIGYHVDIGAAEPYELPGAGLRAAPPDTQVLADRGERQG